MSSTVPRLFRAFGIIPAVLLVVGVVPVLATAADTEDKARSGWLPDFVTLQTAGFAGLAAGGAGYDLGRNHSLSLLLGYVPSGIAVEELWQLSLKYEYRAMDPVALGGDGEQPMHWFPLHLGAGLLHGNHPDLFVELPDRYPSGYYPPTGLLVTLTLGSSLRIGPNRLFLEFTTLQPYLRRYLENQGFYKKHYRFQGLEGIGSLALGLSIELP